MWGVLVDVWTDFTDRIISSRVSIEEYTEDSLNGGVSTGKVWHCKAGYGEYPEVGKSCDGIIYWYKRYKHPLFVPHSIEP